MSKTTQCYGKPQMTVHIGIDAKPAISPALKAEWAHLDKCSDVLFGCEYFKLSDKRRMIVHEAIKGVPSRSAETALLTEDKLIARAAAA